MIDYKELAERLRPQWADILNAYTPGGKVINNEYTAGQLNGGGGDSFKFNMQTGKWAEFNGQTHKGNDIVSYYAAVKGIANSEAKKELMEKYLNEPVKHTYPVKLDATPKIIKAPPNVGDPGEVPKAGVLPSNKWVYRDTDGGALFYVYRYDLPDGKKEFKPMSFTDAGKWIPKMPPGLRPLYNLDKLVANPTKPVMIVEGEKTAESAQIICGHHYTVTTWPSGASAVNKADVSPLKDRNVILWPDADEPGLKAMDFLIAKLNGVAKEVKIIYPDCNSGWDAADALQDGWDWSKFYTWAKPLAEPVNYKKVEASLVEDIPKLDSRPDGDMESSVDQRLFKLYSEIGLDFDQSKTKLLMTSINVDRILRFTPEFEGKVWFDTFHDKSFIEFHGKVQAIEDYTLELLHSYFQEKYKFLKLSKATSDLGVQQAALKNLKNEPQDWVNSLEWDQTPRIEEFMIRAMGAEDNEYTRKVSQNFFVSQAARILNPGCKFDNMVILEGGQGKFKSTALDILGGKWFVEAPSSMETKDFDIQLQGRTIVEFGELDQFRKAETTLIKKRLSCRIDSHRPVNGKKNKDYPRTCVFVGTTNKNDYLQDETGGRRFWPIKTGVIDLEYIKEFKEQFYAEAAVLFNQGFEYWTVPERAGIEQEARRFEHPWESVIGTYFSTAPGLTTNHIATHEIWEKVFLGDVIRITHRDSLIIGKIMRAIGWEYKLLRTGNGVRKEWVRPGYTWLEDHSKELEKPRPPIKNYAPNKIHQEELK